MNADQGFQINEIAGMIRRRAGLIAAIAGGVVLAAIFLAAILPNRYDAWTTLLVEPQAISTKLVEPGVEGSDLNNRLHLMTMQILSRGRLAKVIDELKLYPEESKKMTREEVISLMRSEIHVEPVLPELEATDRLGRSRQMDYEINTFRLYYQSDSAPIAAAVANRLANDFIDEHIKERVQVSGDTAEFITSELQRLQGQIEQVEQRIAEVKNANAGRLPEDLLSNQRLAERNFDMIREARTDLALAESDRAFYAQQALVAAGTGPAYQDLTPERKLDAVNLELANARSRGFTDKHPDVIALTEEVAVLQRQVEENAERTAAGEETGSAAQMNARAEENRAELRAASAKADLDRLNEQADEIGKRIAQTPQVAEQLAALEREWKHLSDSYQSYSGKQLEAGVAANMERRQKGEQFRILEQAFEPPQPTSPNRVVILVMGVVLGLALGSGVALVLEMADSSFHAPRQVQAAFQLPVLAAVPRVLLASDRARIRRRHIAAAAIAAGISGVVLFGAGIGYVTVNGMPGIVKRLLGQQPQVAPGAPPAGTPQG
jgi:polysaccharide chain length determinant protein (PEP-CTERM system associated)